MDNLPTETLKMVTDRLWFFDLLHLSHCSSKWYQIIHSLYPSQQKKMDLFHRIKIDTTHRPYCIEEIALLTSEMKDVHMVSILLDRMKKDKEFLVRYLFLFVELCARFCSDGDRLIDSLYVMASTENINREKLEWHFTLGRMRRGEVPPIHLFTSQNKGHIVRLMEWACDMDLSMFRELWILKSSRYETVKSHEKDRFLAMAYRFQKEDIIDFIFRQGPHSPHVKNVISHIFSKENWLPELIDPDGIVSLLLRRKDVVKSIQKIATIIYNDEKLLDFFIHSSWNKEISWKSVLFNIPCWDENCERFILHLFKKRIITWDDQKIRDKIFQSWMSGTDGLFPYLMDELKIDPKHLIDGLMGSNNIYCTVAFKLCLERYKNEGYFDIETVFRYAIKKKMLDLVKFITSSFTDKSWSDILKGDPSVQMDYTFLMTSDGDIDIDENEDEGLF